MYTTFNTTHETNRWKNRPLHVFFSVGLTLAFGSSGPRKPLNQTDGAERSWRGPSSATGTGGPVATWWTIYTAVPQIERNGFQYIYCIDLSGDPVLRVSIYLGIYKYLYDLYKWFHHVSSSSPAVRDLKLEPLFVTSFVTFYCSLLLTPRERVPSRDLEELDPRHSRWRSWDQAWLYHFGLIGTARRSTYSSLLEKFVNMTKITSSS